FSGESLILPRHRLTLLLSALTLQACGSMASVDTAADSLAAYRQQTLELMQQQRSFQTTDHQAELQWNAPQEWRPQGQLKSGILLVHGLGDSPWSFHDIGE